MAQRRTTGSSSGWAPVRACAGFLGALAALLAAGFMVAVALPQSLALGDALDDGRTRTVEGYLDGRETGGKSHDWEWVVVDASGERLTDDFGAPGEQDGRLEDWRGEPVTAEVVGDEVAATHLPDGSTVRSEDVGLRGAALAAAMALGALALVPLSFVWGLAQVGRRPAAWVERLGLGAFGVALVPAVHLLDLRLGIATDVVLLVGAVIALVFRLRAASAESARA
ncbi:MAG TPA: hypothetical protein VNS55_16090 [Nocardioides sp.]|nr:hypothetical protein [Nocardioides sp.]